MKLSIYNSYINLEDGNTLVYNAMKDCFVAVFGHNISADTTVGILEQTLPASVWEHLVTAGALVEEDVDEVERLRKRIQEIDGDDSIFILHVNPTLDCNFRCWYCYETHQKGSLISQNTVASILNLVRSVLEDKDRLREFRLSFFGGEPLLAYDRMIC